MFDLLKKLLDGAPEPAREDPEAVTAVAALLVEAARSDAAYEPEEAATIERLLRELFGFDETAARAARAEGERAQAGAADLVRFTRVLKSEFSEGERVGLMEALWAVALTDGERDPHEDALLRKLAPLIAVSDRDSAEARRRVAARLA
jgi:uncharacterized tellurite resistance protein B-like protein